MVGRDSSISTMRVLDGDNDSNSNKKGRGCYDGSKVTPSMKECLVQLQSSLTCPLCDEVMDNPCTLPCAHNFCLSCVQTHKSWTCPAPGCGMPRGMLKNGLRINPQLATLVSSYETVTSLLSQAPSYWWTQNKAHKRRYSSISTCTTAASSTYLPNDNDDVEDEMIDLQTSETKHDLDLHLSDVDNDDDDNLLQYPSTYRHPTIHDKDATAVSEDTTTNNTDSQSNTLADSQEEIFLTAPKSFEEIVPTNKENSKSEATTERESAKRCLTPSPWKQALMSTLTNNTIASIMFSNNNETATPSPWKRAAKSILTTNNTTHDPTDITKKNTIALPKTPLDHHHSSRVIMEWPTDEKTLLLQQNTQPTNTTTDITDTTTNTMDGGDDVSPKPSDPNPPDESPQSHRPVEDDDDDDATQTYDIIEDVAISKPPRPETSLPATQDSFPAHISTPDRAHVSHNNNNNIINSMMDPNVSPISFFITPKLKSNSNKTVHTSHQHPTTAKPNSKQSTVPTNQTTKPAIDKLNIHAVSEDVQEMKEKLEIPMLLSYDVEKADRSIWKWYQQNNVIQEFSETDIVHCPFAISTQSVYETCDGFIVPRSYFYLLAVAQGIPIVDFSLVRDHHKQRHKEDLTSMMALDECSNHSRKRRNNNHKQYQVIGDVEATSWNGPQKSRDACRLRPKDLSGNNGLLVGYQVLLHGEFDTVGSRRTTQTSSSQRKKKKDNGSMYTVDRITLLLQSCGATLLSSIHHHLESENKTTIILIRPNPQTRDFRRVEKFLSSHQNASHLPIVKCNWLLDSIAEFEVKPIDNYTKDI